MFLTLILVLPFVISLSLSILVLSLSILVDSYNDISAKTAKRPPKPPPPSKNLSERSNTKMATRQLPCDEDCFHCKFKDCVVDGILPNIKNQSKSQKNITKEQTKNCKKIKTKTKKKRKNSEVKK